MSEEYSNAWVVVTGDGGEIYGKLKGRVFPAERLIHEERASSTLENAEFTRPTLDQLGVRNAVLVTNWFHVPRALAVFRSVQPGRQFAPSFEPMPEPLSPWDRGARTRERFASAAYLVRYGIWCF